MKWALIVFRWPFLESLSTEPRLPILNTKHSITSILGRVCRKTDRVTTALNFPIQRSSSDMLKTSLRFFDKVRQNDMLSNDVIVRWTAHDV